MPQRHGLSKGSDVVLMHDGPDDGTLTFSVGRGDNLQFFKLVPEDAKDFAYDILIKLEWDYHYDFGIT